MSALHSIQKWYSRFFSGHEDSIDALVRIWSPQPVQNPIALISTLLKLWDDFDADAKDLIIAALKKLSSVGALSEISAFELREKVFNTLDRRRLLRNTELQKIFPQLSFPVGYKTSWLETPSGKANSKTLGWLKQHNLVANPFGWDDFKNFSFYPTGFARPGRWEDFIQPYPLFAECPTDSDARALVVFLRIECLPVQRNEDNKQSIIESGKQVFPIWVSLNQTLPSQSPLSTLAHSAACAWLDILPLSPDALLDLSSAEQQALVDLLCWSLGSSEMVGNLIKRGGLSENAAGRLLMRRFIELGGKVSSAYLPQDAILLSWLKIRPPELNWTYLIFPVNDSDLSMHSWWFEQLSSLIPSLFMNGIAIKVFAFSSTPLTLSLPTVPLTWSDARLKLSLDGQFDVAMDPDERKAGKSIRFHELFGPGATEEQTTAKLISASRNSLARMLTLGNRLLQNHCERRGVSDKYLHLEDLDAILETA